VAVEECDRVPEQPGQAAVGLMAAGLGRRTSGMASGVGRSIMNISVLGRLQQSVINPVVRLAWDLGLPIPGDALVETTGRRTGLPRRTPVCDGIEGQTFWLVSQRGRNADWVRNIEANPHVRVKVSEAHAHWRSGTAHILEGAEHQPADHSRRSRQRMTSPRARYAQCHAPALYRNAAAALLSGALGHFLPIG